MKKSPLAILFVIFSLIVIPYSPASVIDNSLTDPAEVIKLYMGETTMMTVSNPKRIAIGNPNIVDIASASKTKINLSPKAVGKTTLVIWDDFGEQSYQVRVFSEDLSDIKRRLDNILATLKMPGISTQVVEDEGKVLIMGKVKTAQEREKINVALGALRDKVADLVELREEEAVVEIEARLLELNQDGSKTLGFTWPGTTTLTEVGSPGIAAAGTAWSTLFRVVNVSRAAFTLTIDALVQEGNARVLSQPRLACQSGKEAELIVGGEKPIFTTQVATTGSDTQGTSVEYKEYGIKLKIKPTVIDEGRIKLGVNVEVSDVGAAETIGSATAPSAKAYPLSKRSAVTELILNDGQTLVIGGLIKQKSEQDIRKVPFLGDIPLVGLIFRKKSAKEGGGQGERGDTELFITVTPKIISQPEVQEAPEKKKIEMKEPVVLDQEVLQPPAEDADKVGQEEEPQAKYTASAPEPVTAYSQIVQKRILEKLTYPASAREAGFYGTVKLRLHISYSGALLAAVVKESSGYNILDKQALDVAKAAGSFPPFPSSITKDDLWVEVPIQYSLD